MPRPRTTHERRRQIVAGLQAVMAGRGYEGASVAAIARAAGLAPGLVHYHFESKQAILLALVERLHERVQERYARLVEGRTDPWERLRAFVDSRLALGPDADREAVACWVVVGAEALRQPEVREAYRRVMLRQGEELGAILGEMVEDPAEDVAALLAAIEGCYQLASTVPDLVPPGSAARSVLRMARGLVGT